MKAIICIIIGAIISIFSQTVLIAQDRFSASVVKVNITPESSQKLLGYAARKSESVRDSIFHKIIFMDDGESQFILVSSDLARISPSLYEKTAKKIENILGVKKENFWWTFTHTHSGPEVGSSGILPLFFLDSDRYHEKYDEAYADFVESSLIEGVLSASKSLVPARLGISWGFSSANINRRAVDINNQVFLAENPEGPIDRKIGLIRIENNSNNTIALIANYPIHGTVLPSTDTRISGDVPGLVAQYIEDEIGAPLLFINGAEGNIAPRFSVSVGQKSLQKADKLLDQFKVLLGQKILEANERIFQTTEKVKFKTERLIVQTPMTEFLRDKEWPEELSDYATISSAGEHFVKFPVSFWLINDDIAIWGAPCELFCDISNHIREHSPYPYTFYYGLTNGSIGYFPTKSDIDLGGYEVRTSPFTKYAEDDLINVVLPFLSNTYFNN